jgi:hypothetical protein
VATEKNLRPRTNVPDRLRRFSLAAGQRRLFPKPRRSDPGSDKFPKTLGDVWQADGEGPDRLYDPDGGHRRRAGARVTGIRCQTYSAIRGICNYTLV